jgi:hypothetical protein
VYKILLNTEYGFWEDTSACSHRRCLLLYLVTVDFFRLWKSQIRWDWRYSKKKKKKKKFRGTEQEFISELSPENINLLFWFIADIHVVWIAWKLFKDKELKVKLRRQRFIYHLIMHPAITTTLTYYSRSPWAHAFMKFCFSETKHSTWARICGTRLRLTNYAATMTTNFVARFADRRDAQRQMDDFDQYDFGSWKIWKELKAFLIVHHAEWSPELILFMLPFPSYEQAHILRIGNALNRKHYDESVYQLTSAVPSRERQVRNARKS